MTQDDIPAVVALQRVAFPPPFPDDHLWQGADLVRHIHVFPEGQWVFEREGVVIGSCSNARIETRASYGDWLSTLGGLGLQKHQQDGGTLFGVDISVHPDHRRQGIGRQFYQARFQYVIENHMDRYLTGCRMPGLSDYLAENPTASIESYAKQVSQGDLFDRTMSPLLKMGLRFVGTELDYMEDPESQNAGAILEWKP